MGIKAGTFIIMYEIFKKHFCFKKGMYRVMLYNVKTIGKTTFELDYFNFQLKYNSLT